MPRVTTTKVAVSTSGTVITSYSVELENDHDQ